jgi:hypothetical protein
MAASAHRSGAFERGSTSIVEAAMLSESVGQQFAGFIVDVDGKAPHTRGQVHIADPAILARVDGTDLPLGQPVTVTLTQASILDGTVRFQAA